MWPIDQLYIELGAIQKLIYDIMCNPWVECHVRIMNISKDHTDTDGLNHKSFYCLTKSEITKCDLSWWRVGVKWSASVVDCRWLSCLVLLTADWFTETNQLKPKSRLWCDWLHTAGTSTKHEHEVHQYRRIKPFWWYSVLLGATRCISFS